MYVGNPEVLDELVFARESDRALSWRRRTTRLLPNLRETCGKFEKTFRIFPEFRGVRVISRPFMRSQNARETERNCFDFNPFINYYFHILVQYSFLKKKKKKRVSVKNSSYQWPERIRVRFSEYTRAVSFDQEVH